jgi:hypothetical protein
MSPSSPQVSNTWLPSSRQKINRPTNLREARAFCKLDSLEDGSIQCWRNTAYPLVPESRAFVSEVAIRKFKRLKSAVVDRSQFANKRWSITARDRPLVAGLPTAAAHIRSCGICGEQSGTGASFLWVLRFPLPLIPLSAPHSSSSIIRDWYSYIRRNSGSGTDWTQSHPTHKKLTNVQRFTDTSILFATARMKHGEITIEEHRSHHLRTLLYQTFISVFTPVGEDPPPT